MSRISKRPAQWPWEHSLPSVTHYVKNIFNMHTKKGICSLHTNVNKALVSPPTHYWMGHSIDPVVTYEPVPKSIAQKVCIIIKSIYRQTPGGCSDGFSFGSMGSWIQAVASLFGRRSIADLSEVASRYRVHRWAGQSSAEELGLYPCGRQNFRPLLRARKSNCPTVRCWRDAFWHPHHFQEQVTMKYLLADQEMSS